MEQLSIFDVYETISKPVQNQSKTTSKPMKNISSSEQKPLKIRSFAYTHDNWCYGGNKRHVITSTIALLEESRVYLRDFYTYPFLYKFNSELEAYKFYMAKLEKLKTYGNGKWDVTLELKIHSDLEDMFIWEDKVRVKEHCKHNEIRTRPLPTIYGCKEFIDKERNPYIAK